MQTIAVTNQKGGAGKTTTSINFAAGLARAGYKVCIVDLDQQCNTTMTFNVNASVLRDEGRLTIADAFLASKPASQLIHTFEARFNGNLALIPGHPALAQVENELELVIRKGRLNEELSPLDEVELKLEHLQRLKKSLSSLDGLFDFIILDTPPRLDFELTAALFAADWYVIPITPSAYDIDGVSKLTATVTKVRKSGNPRLKMLGVVFGRVKSNTNLHIDLRKRLKAQFKEYMADTVIHDSVRFGEMTFHKQTIFEMAPDQPPSDQFEQLTKEWLMRLQNQDNQAPTTNLSNQNFSAEVVNG